MSKSRTELFKYIKSDDFKISPNPIDDVLGEAFSFLSPEILIDVSDEAADVVTVTIELRDVKSRPFRQKRILEIWLSDTPAGEVSAVAPDGGVTVTAGTLIASPTADTHLLIATEADGTATITLEESGAKTAYLNIRTAEGSIITSNPLIWTA